MFSPRRTYSRYIYIYNEGRCSLPEEPIVGKYIYYYDANKYS